jgi:preprotein translocase subunit SecE
MNMKTFKILMPLVIIIGTIFWAFNTIRPQSYNGTNLDFNVSSGSVSVTNPSQQSIPVQIVGAGPRNFRVSSSIKDVSGASTLQRTGANTTQVFEVELPPGVSEFTFSRSNDIHFIANTSIELQATVNPVTSDTVRTTIIAAVIVVLGTLFYLSHTNGHRWISAARRKKALAQTTAQEAESQNFDRIMKGRITGKP